MTLSNGTNVMCFNFDLSEQSVHEKGEKMFAIKVCLQHQRKISL